MNRKRIAIVVSHPIQHFCPQYASWAKNEHIELKVFFSSAWGAKRFIDPDFKTEIAWDNLRLNEFNHVFLNGDEVLPVTKELDAPAMEQALSEFKPSVIVVYGYFQKLSRRAIRWAKSNRVKIAYISDTENRQHKNKLKEFIKYPLLRYYFLKFDYFLTVGNANEAYYRSMGVPEKKMVRMHFSIDLELYSRAYEKKEQIRKELRSQFGIMEDEMVISVVGKLVAWKNQDHLIEVLKLIRDEQIKIHLFIIGSGTMQQEWEQKASEIKHHKVHFTGFVAATELPGYYAASDLYVHPAAAEPHSLAISEAIYMGLPVIVSDRTGSYGDTDDVQIGKNGYVYTFGNLEQLAKLILRVKDEDALLKNHQAYSHQLGIKHQQRSHFDICTELYSLI
jgi:glycosyltransferase involved in cell wall biosynthesis